MHCANSHPLEAVGTMARPLCGSAPMAVEGEAPLDPTLAVVVEDDTIAGDGRAVEVGAAAAATRGAAALDADVAAVVLALTLERDLTLILVLEPHRGSDSVNIHILLANLPKDL